VQVDSALINEEDSLTRRPGDLSARLPQPNSPFLTNKRAQRHVLIVHHGLWYHPDFTIYAINSYEATWRKLERYIQSLGYNNS
jgi:hypothetical protein